MNEDIDLDTLLDTVQQGLGRPGSLAWQCEIFRRAYCTPQKDGPFDRVLERVARGFSVLVLVPGNCIAATAETVKQSVAGSWTELGLPGDKNRNIGEIWELSTGILDRINKWFGGEENAPPRVIFHNLDWLSDGRDGLDPNLQAKTALFYVTGSVRTGTVVGLSDREAGTLPAAIIRPFPEQIWLGEISDDCFARLIPRKLGERLAETRDGKQVLPRRIVWLLAARLRWTDPIRAVTIMDSVSRRKDRGIEDVLAEITRATQAVEFIIPDKIKAMKADPATGAPTGFEAETIEVLRRDVIEPFRRWAGFRGEGTLSWDDWQTELLRLPSGLILFGPPGTGKTELARWVAKSIRLPVRLVTAADLRRANFGESESLVHALFGAARRAAPCVIVLDDADDLLPDRDTLRASSVGSAEGGIVHAFLQELEGFRGRLDGVLVILTTNRYSRLDRAAKARFHIHQRIPYPLNETQVLAIVRSVAESYKLGELGADVTKRLCEIFLRSVRPTNLDVSKPEVRASMDGNLYAPRDIAAAMRLLVGRPGEPLTLDDVTHMENYLERMGQQSLSESSPASQES